MCGCAAHPHGDSLTAATLPRCGLAAPGARRRVGSTTPTQSRSRAAKRPRLLTRRHRRGHLLLDGDWWRPGDMRIDYAEVGPSNMGVMWDEVAVPASASPTPSCPYGMNELYAVSLFRFLLFFFFLREKRRVRPTSPSLLQQNWTPVKGLPHQQCITMSGWKCSGSISVLAQAETGDPGSYRRVFSLKPRLLLLPVKNTNEGGTHSSVSSFVMGYSTFSPHGYI